MSTKRDTVYDVIVVGGGTTGGFAALSAAREGAKTALIERDGFIGGNAANGLPWLGFHHAGTGKQCVGGLPFSFIKELQDMGGATRLAKDPICGSAVGVNSTFLKLLFAEKFKEYGITSFLHTVAMSAYSDEQGLWHIRTFNSSGQWEVIGKTVIDCTDIAAMAISAGAEYSFGRQSDGKPQASSAVIRFAGIDMEALVGYFKENPKQMRPFKIESDTLQQYISSLSEQDIFVMGAFPDIIAVAKSEGVSYLRDRIIGVANVKEKELILVCSRSEGVDPRDNEGYTSAEHDALLQTKGILKLLREYIPGCKNAYPIASGHTLGIRETYHISGDTTLLPEQLMEGYRFEDAIAVGGYHLDVHSPDGGLKSQFPKAYSIPYSCMLPKGLDNMLVAGRCVSATTDAQASIRVIPILGAMGQAAGLAAALAVSQNKTVRNVDIAALQKKLKFNGAILP